MAANHEVRLIGPEGLSGPEVAALAALLRRLVLGGAALGWVDPPAPDEVRRLCAELAAGVAAGDAALALAVVGDRVAGFGYWRRYRRPTHRPNADVQRVAVDPDLQGQGLGRTIMITLLAAARHHRIEVLTLDLRGDNERAAVLYQKLGFQRYGVLERFVAVGGRRYDKLLYALDLRGPLG